MKPYYLLFFVILIPALLFGQQTTITEEISSPSFRVNAYPLEFETEFSLTKKMSLLTTAGLSYEFQEGIFQDRNFFKASDPYIQLFPRFYYNLDKRLDQGKNISGYSGNYIGLYSVLHFEDINETERFLLENTFLVGPTWGLQRKINDVAHLDLFAGFGAGWLFEGFFEEPRFAMSSILGLKIGIYL